jgi:hypothetical protein
MMWKYEYEMWKHDQNVVFVFTFRIYIIYDLYTGCPKKSPPLEIILLL